MSPPDLLSSLRTLFEWVDAFPSSIELRGSQYVYSWILVAHVVSVCAFTGLVLLMDLRLLGIGYQQTPFPRLQRQLFPWQMGGMALSLVTGVVLVYAQPLRYYGSVYFWMKMAAMALAGLNALAFHYVSYPAVAAREGQPALPIGARFAGGLGLVLWATVVVEGRLIPYALIWFPQE